MAQAIGSLLVEIGADTSGLESGGRRASKSMDDLGRQAAALGARMAALGAAAAAVGAAFTAKLVKSGLEAIDSQAKLARSLDASIDGLRGLQLAASEAGVKNEQLTSALRNLNARLGEAMRGTGEGKAALDALGLSARALSQLDTDQRMAVIADRMRELGLSSSQAADLLRKLGFENENFVPLMLAGGDAIRQARQDVDAFGISLSAVDAAKVEMANDAMARIGLTFEAIRKELTIALAPLLKELADRFNALSRENQGFAGIARSTAETVITAFGKVADALRVLQIAFKSIELVVQTLKATQITVAEAIIRLWAGVGDELMAVVNAGIRGLNALGANLAEIPSPSDSAFVRGLREMGAQARAEVGQVRMELLDLVTAEWPSKGVEEFLAAVRERAQEAAEAVAGVAIGGAGADLGGGDNEEAERRQKELDAQREALEMKLQQIREYAMTEDELEIERHIERMERLRAALEEELITKEEFKELEVALEEKHRARLEEIAKRAAKSQENVEKASLAARYKMAADQAQNALAMVSTHSRKMFEVNKVAGIANAVVSTYTGVAKALENPWPLNLAAAASTLAMGLAQISQIKSASFSGGGGGTAPSLAGSPGTPVTPVASSAPAQSGVIVVEGIDEKSLFSGRAVRELAEKLQEHIRDGGTVRFA